MTLTEFILARIAEDEAHVNGWCEDYVPCGQREHPGHRSEGRMRAECEAKRRIVELHRGFKDEHPGTTALHYLAAVYADHPDYDEAWRPSPSAP